ncbi:MAG: hypothetical protein H6658_19405 [Ardenticatenaceae bacterium]|nr:hypothetical protein [Ardenticatenaceae bacterium]
MRPYTTATAYDDFLAQAQDGQATATIWIGQEDMHLRLLTIDIQFNTALGAVTLKQAPRPLQRTSRHPRTLAAKPKDWPTCK